MNYGQLKSQFTGLMNRRDLTANSALVSTFIDQAIMRIQRELRVPSMEKSVDVTITAQYAGLPIPSDLLELISIVPQSTTYKRLDRAKLEDALNLSLNTGRPDVFAREGNKWVLGPSPVTGDIIRVEYYAEFGALSADADTNVLTETSWDLVVYAALSAACDYYKDNRIQAFEARYVQIRDAMQAQADDDEFNGTNAVQPCWAWPDDDCTIATDGVTTV